MHTIILYAAAMFMVVLGGLFAALDSALATVSPARVDDLVRESRWGAAALRRLLDERPLYISLAVLLRTAAEVGSTVLVLTALHDGGMSLGAAAAVAAVAMIVIDFVFIGVGPRTLGRQHAYTVGTIGATPLRAIAILLGPVTRLLILLGNIVTPGRGFRNGPFASEIEVREIVDLASESGVVEDDERRMIQSVFEFSDTHAGQVMVPRPEMVWIEADKTMRQALALALRSGHSRIPVVGENVDDILGIVHLRDLADAHLFGDRAGPLAEVLRPARFVPESKPVDDLLDDMRRTHNHMAIVVDEYGSVAGLVTIEDLIEEIVGEINDEFDANEVAPIARLEDGSYRVSARLHLDDLATELGIEIEEEDVDTVGGLLSMELGRVPLPGAHTVAHGLDITAEGGFDRRGRVKISTAVIRRIVPDEPGESDDSPAEAGHPDESGRPAESGREHEAATDRPPLTHVPERETP